MPNIIEIDYSDLNYFHHYYAELVVMFTMQNCGWCTKAIPELKKATALSSGKIPVLHVVYHKDKSILEKENLQGFPTCRKYTKKKQFIEYSGNRSAKSYLQFMQQKA
jgi:hypothetical protein